MNSVTSGQTQNIQEFETIIKTPKYFNSVAALLFKGTQMFLLNIIRRRVDRVDSQTCYGHNLASCIQIIWQVKSQTSLKMNNYNLFWGLLLSRPVV